MQLLNTQNDEDRVSLRLKVVISIAEYEIRRKYDKGEINKVGDIQLSWMKTNRKSMR